MSATQAKTNDFKEYIASLLKTNPKRAKEAIEFVTKYTPLMASGDMSKFEVGEKPMTLKEALTTTDAAVLMTKVMEGTLEKAAEPLYIASKFFKTINLESGNRVVFPAIGALRAYEMGEGQEYRQETLDIMLKERASEVTVTKKGVMVAITEEMIEDSQWEVVGMHIEAAGRALARLKEELIFKAMSKHGWVTFDNAIRDQYPEAGTTGRDEYGNYNGTLAIEDLFDIILALMNNEYMPTDVLVHPLTWGVFVKNGLIDIFSKPALGTDATLGTIDQDATKGRLPISINIIASPFIPFNRVDKTFDMYCIDRNNVGVIVQREKMTTDQFTDPYRDIFNLKFKERYGIGILDEGKAVSVAKNIALDVTYEKPILVRTINVNDYESQN